MKGAVPDDFLSPGAALFLTFSFLYTHNLSQLQYPTMFVMDEVHKDGGKKFEQKVDLSVKRTI